MSRSGFSDEGFYDNFDPSPSEDRRTEQVELSDDQSSDHGSSEAASCFMDQWARAYSVGPDSPDNQDAAIGSVTRSRATAPTSSGNWSCRHLFPEFYSEGRSASDPTSSSSGPYPQEVFAIGAGGSPSDQRRDNRSGSRSQSRLNNPAPRPARTPPSQPPLRPVKAAIAASAEYVSGLLPSHLVYSSAHETAFEDWTWSVGCNPLSITSKGWQISEFQQDVIARNYIITAVEESIKVVNSAIQRLITERTTEQGFKIFKTHERLMVEKYNSVVSLWRRVSVMSKGLRYGDAVKLLSLLEDASHGFSHAVNSTISSLHPIQCARERKLDVQLDLTTIPAFVAVFVLLWFLLRPRRSKPKIN